MRSTLEKSTHRSRNNRYCRPESAPAHSIWRQQERRAVQHLSRANFAPNRADGRDRRRPQSAAPARSAPAALRAFYGAEPSPSPYAMVVLRRNILQEGTWWTLQRVTPWVWLWCERCQHHAPLACAVASFDGGRTLPAINYGPLHAAPVAAAKERVSSIQAGPAIIGFQPFPTSIKHRVLAE